MIITNINSTQVFDAILRTDTTYAASELTICLIEEGKSEVTYYTPINLVYSNNSVQVIYTIEDGFFSNEQSFLLTIKDANSKMLFRDKLQVRGAAVDEVIEDDRYELADSDDGFVFIDDSYNDTTYVGITETLAGDKHFTHNQSSASATWSITHNLAKFPAVSVVDSGKNVVVGDVQYVDSNSIIVNFTASFSGKAYMN